MINKYGLLFSAIILASFSVSACANEQIKLNDPSRDPDATEELKQWERLDVIKPAELEVEWFNAPKHLGKWVAATGKIVASYDSGKATFLNFDTDWKGKFHAVIFSRSYSDYSPLPAQKYFDKRVKIIGKVGEHRGTPQIVIDRPEQIIILP